MTSTPDSLFSILSEVENRGGYISRSQVDALKVALCAHVPPLRPEWDGWVRFQSECKVNGVTVPAGTAWGPFEKSRDVALSETGDTHATPREVMLMLARALSTIRYEVTGALANYLSPNGETKRSLIRIKGCARDALESLKNAAPGKGAEATHDSPATPIGTPALRAAGTASIAAPTSEIGRSHAQAAPESVTGTLSSNTLEKLLQTARNLKMSPKQVYDQRVSFIYGNQPEESTTTIEQIKEELAGQGIVDPGSPDGQFDKQVLPQTSVDALKHQGELVRSNYEQKIARLERELAETRAKYERLQVDFRARCEVPSATLHIPEGWKLVPVEPTPEMKKAGGEYRDACARLSQQRTVGGYYRAMLQVAPSYVEQKPHG